MPCEDTTLGKSSLKGNAVIAESRGTCLGGFVCLVLFWLAWYKVQLSEKQKERPQLRRCLHQIV